MTIPKRILSYRSNNIFQIVWINYRKAERNLQTNGNTVHVLENLLTIRGNDFIKYLKDIKKLRLK